MSIERHPRIFVAWPNGAFVNSESLSFGRDLMDLVEQYGTPSVVEYRETYEGETTREVDDAPIPRGPYCRCPDCG
jgi:hypothetical protein